MYKVIKQDGFMEGIAYGEIKHPNGRKLKRIFWFNGEDTKDEGWWYEFIDYEGDVHEEMDTVISEFETMKEAKEDLQKFLDGVRHQRF